MDHNNFFSGNRISESHSIFLEVERLKPARSIKTELPWSLAVNVLLSIQLSDFIEGQVSLFLDYTDSRGERQVLVDNLFLEFDSALLFSNLIQLPIRGEITDARLTLSGITAGVDVDVEVLHIQPEESRSFVENLPLSQYAGKIN
ncbi:MAG: hypothetical protein V2I33_08760 [Kangiellaceae bacterium]|jgi:hypothetical protein|nr:hypothetical protein [Kangiellaceae bacterium]